MGLASAMSTSLTGLNAAETTIDVVGNNLANANTVGFKASDVSFATQFLQTLSLGSAPTTTTGGTNPRQTGLGAMVAATTPDFTQGTVDISNSPTDMAIQGDGFFIVQGAGGEQLYTRNGVFKLNANSELVTSTGNRLLGYGVTPSYDVDPSSLEPLRIPIGSAAVAKATETAFLEGTLSPTGDLGDTAGIIRTDVLGDAQYTRPSGAPSAASVMQIPTAATLDSTSTTGPSCLTPSSTYSYKFAFYDAATQTYSAATAPLSVALAADQNRVTIDDLPTPPSGQELRMFRTVAGADPVTGTYYLDKSIAGGTTLSIDSMEDSSLILQDTLLPGTNPAPADPTLTGRTGAAYYYKTVGYDPTTGTEGVPSAATAVTMLGLDNQAVLDDLPPDGTSTYSQRRLYRTLDGASSGGPYYLVGTQDIATATFTDSAAESQISLNPSSHPELNQSLLTGNYSYYVTFVNASGLESRPSNAGSVTLTNGRVQLSDIPVPAVDDPSAWTKRRIYRNVDGGSTFYMVEELDNLDASLTYTDGMSDATLSQQTQTLSFDGQPINEATLLRNLVRRTDGTNYEQLFKSSGTLNFTGQKGGRDVSTKELTVDDTTTVGALLRFMGQAVGLQTGPGIPLDKSGLAAGGSVDGSRLRIVSNTGTGNAVSIDLAGMQFVSDSGQTTINMPFASTQQAKGNSAMTDFVVYDSKGISIPVHLTAVLQSRSNGEAVYRWYADSSGNLLPDGSGVTTAVGTGTITFNGNGNVQDDGSNRTVVINREDTSSSTPLSFALDFTQLSGLATSTSSVAVTSQDGSAAGVLTSFIVGEDGLIRGVFSNGISRSLGQIRLVRFGNPAGLEQKGQNLFASGVNSGNAVPGNPNENGIGSIVGGATELSNSDIGANLIDLILASTMYRGNSRVITTVQDMFDVLLNLQR